MNQENTAIHPAVSRGNFSTLSSATTKAIRNRLGKKGFTMNVMFGSYVKIYDRALRSPKINYTYLHVTKEDSKSIDIAHEVDIFKAVSGMDHIVSCVRTPSELNYEHSVDMQENDFVLLIIEGSTLRKLKKELDKTVLYMESETPVYNSESFKFNLMQEAEFESTLYGACSNLKKSLDCLLSKKVVEFEVFKSEMERILIESKFVLAYNRIQNSFGTLEEFERERELEMNEEAVAILMGLKMLNDNYFRDDFCGIKLDKGQEEVDQSKELYLFLDMQY